MSDVTWTSYWKVDFDWDIINFRGDGENEKMLIILSGRHSKLAVWATDDRLALAVRLR